MPATPLVSPSTAVGVIRSDRAVAELTDVVVAPARRPAVCVTAHEWSSPAATAATPLVEPRDIRGVDRPCACRRPVGHSRLQPQHFSPPAVVSAQVCALPAVTAETPVSARPHGRRRPSVRVPSPSWPSPVVAPALHAATAAAAQVWYQRRQRQPRATRQPQHPPGRQALRPRPSPRHPQVPL